MFLMIGCISLNQRNPSGKKLQNEVTFKMYSNGYNVDADYSYELLELNELSNNKVIFNKHKINSSKARERVRNWVSQLAEYSEKLNDSVEFTTNKLQISLKKSAFKNLFLVLDLIEKSEAPETRLRKRVEVITAFNQNFKDPVELKIEILTLPFEVLKRFIAYGVSEFGPKEKLQINDSSFWTDRSAEKINMAAGASHVDLSQFKKEVCEYSGAKHGYGIHPGFKIKCFGNKFKVKFGEALSAPLNSRIYYRLGYNVPAIHYLENLTMRYDRKIFTEIDQGKSAQMRIKLLGKEVKSIPVVRRGNIRSDLQSVVMKDGRRLSAEEFFKKLLGGCENNEMSCEMTDSSFNAEFEKEVSHLIFKEITLVEDNLDHQFGSWAFDELDHKEITEIKALVLVGAWTGNYDLRKDNNLLQWSSDTGEIKHYISDPGSGLANQGIPGSGVNLNDMRWNVTSALDTTKGDGPTETSLVVDGFRPIIDHKVFGRLNQAEARWMVRLIAGVREDEITEALIGAGFSVAEMLLTREKLISLQQNMVKTFGLESEFNQLMQRPINKKINYQLKDEAQIFLLQNGRSYQVPERGYSLINGVLSP